MRSSKAVLLNLDDTILDDSSLVDTCWREACGSHADRFVPFRTEAVVGAIQRSSKWFWSDPERHRAGRLSLDAARREVVRLALGDLGIADAELAAEVGDAYSHRRDAGMKVLPDAIETLRWLRERGSRLALLTNGAGPAQRKKIERFGIEHLFDTIVVEGEVGFGKPDERVYRLALEELGTRAADAWMIGDNLEWDVAAPQRLGVFGVWIDVRGSGLPENASTNPDCIVRSLAEVPSLLQSTV